MERHTSLVDTGPRLMRRPQRLLSWLLFSLTLAMIASLGLSKGALAVAPPAGTPIGNQATADYTDASGTARHATSNMVITTVNKVHALTLEDARNLEAGIGAPVYFPHTVTNTGNTPDTFNLTAADAGADFALGSLTIYADENRDGMPDNFTAITVTPELAAGATFSFVVAGNVPTTGVAASDTAGVTVTATSQGDNTKVATNADTVKITDKAVINVQKSANASTSISPSSAPITYTLTYYNNGKADANEVEFSDTLNAGLELVTTPQLGNAFWSQRTTVLGDSVGTNQTGNGTATIQYWVTIDGSGRQVVHFKINNVPFNTSSMSGSSGYVTFDVRVKSNVQPSVIPNSAVYAYNDGTTPITTQNVTGKNTNIVNLEVLPTVDVTGTGDDWTDNANSNFGTAVYQGGTFYFHNTFTNTGTGTDTFDITYHNSTFPVGTTFTLYNGDGSGHSSQLQDSNGNNIPDTGPLAPGASANIWLQVTLPPYADGTASNGGVGPFEVQKTATSSLDPNVTKSVTVTDKIPTITKSVVDLLSSAPDTSGAATDGSTAHTTYVVETQAGNPGTTLTYHFDMLNSSAVADNFDLAVSDGGSTWGKTITIQLTDGTSKQVAVIFKDSNGAIITNTGTIKAGDHKVFTAEIILPDNAQPVLAQEFHVQALSPNTSAVDTLVDALTVNTVDEVTIEPNHAGQTYPGNSITYSHTVTNHSNVQKVITLSTGDVSISNQGFTSLIYRDTVADGILKDDDGAPITSITLNPGESADIFTKVFAPANATPGNMNTTTVSAEYPLTAGGTATATVTDATTVVEGQLTLEKLQAKGSGTAVGGGDPFTINTAFTRNDQKQDPGKGIVYKITVTNNGTAPVKDVVVYDTTPAFTTYLNSHSVTAGTYNYADGAVWRVNDTGTFTTSGSSIATPASDGTGALTFDISSALTNGELLPGESVTIYYSVRINQ